MCKAKRAALCRTSELWCDGPCPPVGWPQAQPAVPGPCGEADDLLTRTLNIWSKKLEN